MYQLSFSSLFGGSSAQTATTVSIAKQELVSLTPALENHAEELLIAILLQALNSFSGEIITSDGQQIDISGMALTFDNSDAFEFIKIFLWKPFYEVRNESVLVDVRQIIFRYFQESGNEYEN